MKEHATRRDLPLHLLSSSRAWRHLHINPSGKFIIGGPQGDAGLTGRKCLWRQAAGGESYSSGGVCFANTRHKDATHFKNLKMLLFDQIWFSCKVVVSMKVHFEFQLGRRFFLWSGCNKSSDYLYSIWQIRMYQITEAFQDWSLGTIKMAWEPTVMFLGGWWSSYMAYTNT